MQPPSFRKQRGYTRVTWLALLSLLPMSIFLGIRVRAVFLIPGLLALVFLVLGVVNRRRGDDE